MVLRMLALEDLVHILLTHAHHREGLTVLGFIRLKRIAAYLGHDGNHSGNHFLEGDTHITHLRTGRRLSEIQYVTCLMHKVVVFLVLLRHTVGHDGLHRIGNLCQGGIGSHGVHHVLCHLLGSYGQRSVIAYVDVPAGLVPCLQLVVGQIHHHRFHGTDAVYLTLVQLIGAEGYILSP